MAAKAPAVPFRFSFQLYSSKSKRTICCQQNAERSGLRERYVPDRLVRAGIYDGIRKLVLNGIEPAQGTGHQLPNFIIILFQAERNGLLLLVFGGYKEFHTIDVAEQCEFKTPGFGSDGNLFGKTVHIKRD